MLEVKTGTKVTCTKVGQSKNGAYAFGTVNAETGYSKITVWFNGADKCKEGCEYEITGITRVAKSARKVEKDGTTKWYDEYSCNADVKAVDDAPEGFASLDEDCPF